MPLTVPFLPADADIPVPHAEHEGSPTLDYTPKGTTATRVIHVAWEDFEAVVDHLYDVGAANPARKSYPGKPRLVVENVRVEPMVPDKPTGSGQKPNTYPGGAKLTISYKTPEFSETDFEAVRFSLGAEYTTFPAAALLWPQFDPQGLRAGGAATLLAPSQAQTAGEDVHAGVVTPVIEHTMRFEQVKTLPHQALRRCVGRTNSLRGFLNAPEGCVLFSGAEITRDTNSQGDKVYNIEYRFSEKNNGGTGVFLVGGAFPSFLPGFGVADFVFDPANPDPCKGWNFFLKPGTGTFELLTARVDDSTIRYIYPMVDFTGLFNFNAVP